VNERITTQIRPSSTSFPIHYSLIILRFDVLESAILTAPINNWKPFRKLSQTRTRDIRAVPDSPTKFVPENVCESRTMVLLVITAVLFPFPSQLSVGLQNINSTNKFSEVTSCLKVYLFYVPLPAFRKHKIQFVTQFYDPRQWGNVGGMCGRIGGRNT
jgi:hypothetical protein